MKYIKKFESNINLTALVEELLTEIVDICNVDVKILGDSSVHDKQNTSRVVIIKMNRDNQGSIIKYALHSGSLDTNTGIDTLSIDDGIKNLEDSVLIFKLLKKVTVKLFKEGYRSTFEYQSNNNRPPEFRLTIVRDNRI